MTELSKQFVPVRIVRMNDVDLRQFQFDYDLTWAAFFMNADGTIYGRYGTRASQDAMTHISLPSLKKAMRRALELHKGYPGNRVLFEGKQGTVPRFRSVREMEPLKELINQGGHGVVETREGVKEGCVHCHQVFEGYHKVAYAEGNFDPKTIWVYPLPENIGLVMDVDEGTRVNRVLPNSFAEKVGLRVDDTIETLNGQVILSQADIQWVLHHLPTPGALRVEYQRNGARRTTTIPVEGDWRKTDISWRGSMWSLRPDLGFYAPEMSAEEKSALGIAPVGRAMKVRWVPQKRAREAGLKEGDVVVSFDGDATDETFGHLSVRVRLNYKSGVTVPVVVLRDGKRVNLTLPLD